MRTQSHFAGLHLFFLFLILTCEKRFVQADESKVPAYIAQSLRQEMQTLKRDADIAVPYLDAALTFSKKAKIDRSISTDNTSWVEMPETKTFNHTRYLISSPSADSKAKFISSLESQLLKAVKIQNLGPRPSLPFYSIDNQITAFSAGYLIDPELKVLSIVSEKEFVGKYQGHREPLLFTGWNTSQLSDGAKVVFDREQAVCVGNAELPIANVGKSTVLHLVKIDDEAMDNAVASLPAEEFELLAIRTWKRKDGASFCEGRMVDFDKKSITVRTHEGKTESMLINDLSVEDRNYAIGLTRARKSKK